MEIPITNFCKSLATFLTTIESSSQTLTDSLHRRPVHLDSAASSFLHGLDRRIAATAGDLNMLDSMAFGTVSVEELLGHCNEVFKVNQKCIQAVEERMGDFGYVDELEIGEDNGGRGSLDISMEMTRHGDNLSEDPISLQSLGLSDVCLATLASQDNAAISSPNIMSHGKMSQYEPRQDDLDGLDTFGNAAAPLIEASKGDYDNLPSYMKSLAPWEELQEAVIKMNFHLGKIDGNNRRLNQADIEKLGLGCKGKSYLLLLIRMKQLVVETVDNSIFYRVCA